MVCKMLGNWLTLPDGRVGVEDAREETGKRIGSCRPDRVGNHVARFAMQEVSRCYPGRVLSWRTVALCQCPLDLSVGLIRQAFKADIGGHVFGSRFYRLGGGGGNGGGGEPDGMEGEGGRAGAGGGPEDVR